MSRSIARLPVWLLVAGLFPAVSLAQDGTARTTVPSEEIQVDGVATRAAKPDLTFKSDPFSLETMVFNLPSGLRLMFQQDNTLPTVAITTTFDVGSSDDPEGQDGMAHVLEHSWFLSTQPDMPKIWTMQQSDMGCSLNAFTNFDNTVYMSVCPARELQRMLELVSHLVMNPVREVTAEQLENEIEVVRNEIRMRSENGNIPFFPIQNFIGKHTYGDDHPYHRAIAGDHETVRNITLASMNAWVDENYKPENATIMVVGDFDASDVREVMTWILANMDPKMIHPKLTKELIAFAPREGVDKPDRDNPDHWWLVAMDPENPDQMLPDVLTAELPIRAREFAGVTVPERRTAEFGVYESTVEDPWVVVTWPLPPAYQGQDTLMRMTGFTMDIVANGMSWMNHSPVEDVDNNIDEWQGCGALSGKYGTTMMCAATIKDADKNPEHTAERILDQLYMVYNPDFQKQLFNMYGQVRMDILAGTLRSLDLYASVGAGRATDISIFAHFMGRPDVHSTAMNEAMTLELAAVQGMMEQYITRDKASSFLVKPVERDDVLEVSAEGTDHYAVSGLGAGENHTLTIDQITPDLLRDAFLGPDLEKVRDYTFSNGLRVVILPHGEAPMAVATVITRGGYGNDATGREDFAWTFSEWNREDALTVAGQWSQGRTESYEYVTLKGSSGNLDGILWMLRDAIDNRDHAVRNKGTWLDDSKDDIVSDFGELDFHVSDLIRQHVNPGHFAANWDHADLDRLIKMTGGEVKDIIANRWQPSNATLLIVGNVDPAQALADSQTYFGGWKPGRGVEPYVVGEVQKPKPVGGQKVYVLDKKGVTQTEVNLACPGYFHGYDAWPAHGVLSTGLRNAATDILRETSGVVYSPYAGSSSNLTSATVQFSAPVQNSAANYARDTYIKLAQQVETDGIEEKYFRYSQWTMANQLVSTLQSQDQVYGYLSGLIGAGKSWEYIFTYEERLADMQSEDLQKTLGKCVENSITTFAGPVDEVTDQLDEAGVAYEVIDWKQRGYDMHHAVDPKGAAKAAKKRAKAKAKKAKKEAKEAKEAKKKGESGDE
jgi:predicted Zn-dependent peptidase